MRGPRRGLGRPPRRRIWLRPRRRPMFRPYRWGCLPYLLVLGGLLGLILITGH